MSEPGQFDRWVRQWGGRIILVLLVISALIQIWRMWEQRGC